MLLDYRLYYISNIYFTQKLIIMVKGTIRNAYMKYYLNTVVYLIFGFIVPCLICFNVLMLQSFYIEKKSLFNFFKKNSNIIFSAKITLIHNSIKEK